MRTYDSKKTVSLRFQQNSYRQEIKCGFTTCLHYKCDLHYTPKNCLETIIPLSCTCFKLIMADHTFLHIFSHDVTEVAYNIFLKFYIFKNECIFRRGFEQNFSTFQVKCEKIKIFGLSNDTPFPTYDILKLYFFVFYGILF